MVDVIYVVIAICIIIIKLIILFCYCYKRNKILEERKRLRNQITQQVISEISIHGDVRQQIHVVNMTPEDPPPPYSSNQPKY